MMPQPKPIPRPREDIAGLLRDAIGAGRYRAGVQLPTVREIADQYGCAPRTAQEALRILATEGLIITRPRQGSIVAIADASIDGPLEQLRRSRTGGLFRATETAELLRAELVVGHPGALVAFGLDEDAEVGLREYLVRTADGRVITYGRSFIPPDIWAAIPDLRCREPIADGIIGAIRRLLERETIAVPARRQAAAATEEEAELLGVDADSPVLIEVIESQERLDGGVVEWNISIHPANFWVGP